MVYEIIIPIFHWVGCHPLYNPTSQVFFIAHFSISIYCQLGHYNMLPTTYKGNQKQPLKSGNSMYCIIGFWCPPVLSPGDDPSLPPRWFRRLEPPSWRPNAPHGAEEESPRSDVHPWVAAVGSMVGFCGKVVVTYQWLENLLMGYEIKSTILKSGSLYQGSFQKLWAIISYDFPS